jgi:hypothetical protein
MNNIVRRLISCGNSYKLGDILRRSVAAKEDMLTAKIEALSKTYPTSLLLTELLAKSNLEIFGNLLEKSTEVSLRLLKKKGKLTFTELVGTRNC